MAKKRITRKQIKRDEFVETAMDIEKWASAHWKLLVTASVAVLVATLLGYGGMSLVRQRAANARRKLSEAVALYQAGDYKKALPALEAVGERGETGQIARFYRGAVLLRLGRADEAAKFLNGVLADADDPALVATTRALLAEAAERSGDPAKAAEQWKELAEVKPSFYPPPLARLRLGMALLADGRTDEARAAWQMVVEQTPESPEAEEARRLLLEHVAEVSTGT